MKTFRDKVIEHRAALGLSQQQLADKAGIGVRTIGNYESGARLPYAAQLYKLAKALGVSTEYLKNDEIEDPSYGLDRMIMLKKCVLLLALKLLRIQKKC